MSRRLVAVLFTDLVGWTSLAERLDPEPLQVFLDSYYEICVTAVRRHGGVVEKFIGDAVMAVFGAERSREDDAVCALLTAFAMRDEVARLTISGAHPAIHCGIATGEALVTHSEHAGVRIVGDVVNLAARLQSAAQANEIVVNDVTARLVRAHAELAPMPPLALKGKREPVPAWRATAPSIAPVEDRSRLFDREAERAFLRDAFDEVARERSSRTVLVLGPPGIGKSRLVRETIGTLPDGTPVATGHCPARPEPGGYGPFGELLTDLLTGDAVTDRIAGVRDGRLLEVLGHMQHPDGGIGPGPEECRWAIRELMRHVKPAVLIVDDMQWAEPLVLELIADLATAPALLVGISRQETSLPGARTLVLDPLPRPDTTGLVAHLMTTAENAEVVAQGMDVLDRVVDDCAGNPLFAELMVETLALGYALGDVPPSITAMIGAAVDRLPAELVTLLEAASVVGCEFTAEHLSMLGADPAPEAMTDLIKKQMISAGPTPESYRFAQQLTQGVVYGRLDKRQRLAWHRALADRDVAPAQHLGVAVRLLGDLRPDDDELPAIAGRAAAALLAEGTLALRRRNLPAALDLLRRAHELPLPADDPRRAVATLRLSDALLFAGDLRGARTVAEPENAGLAVRIHRALLALRTGEGVGEPDGLRPDPDDHLAASQLEQLRMLRQIADGQFGAAERSAFRAFDHAEAMGDEYEADRLRAAICEVGQWSPTPVPTKLAFCRDVAARFAGDRVLLAPVLVVQARLLALVGDLDGAAAALEEARKAVTDLRLTMAGVLVDQGTGLVASLAGQHREAERHLRSAARALEETGHRPTALTVRLLALRERLRWNHDDEAVAEIRALTGQADRMDLRGRILGETAALRASARPGEQIAERIDRVRTLLARTDDACLRGDVLAELAAAYRQCGDDASADAVLGDAAEAYAGSAPSCRCGGYADGCRGSSTVAPRPARPVPRPARVEHAGRRLAERDVRRLRVPGDHPGVGVGRRGRVRRAGGDRRLRRGRRARAVRPDRHRLAGRHGRGGTTADGGVPAGRPGRARDRLRQHRPRSRPGRGDQLGAGAHRRQVR
ncbi:hypothetical protein CIK06_04295 [Plantactinospora sp. KBS50]|nr:hypothetical protein CIK06_04295 [Plantactinospora sp. KBS50]